MVVFNISCKTYPWPFKKLSPIIKAFDMQLKTQFEYLENQFCAFGQLPLTIEVPINELNNTIMLKIGCLNKSNGNI